MEVDLRRTVEMIARRVDTFRKLTEEIDFSKKSRHLLAKESTHWIRKQSLVLNSKRGVRIKKKKTRKKGLLPPLHQNHRTVIKNQGGGGEVYGGN